MSSCSCAHRNPAYVLNGLSNDDPMLQNLNDILNARSYLSTTDIANKSPEDKVLYGLLIDFELKHYEVQVMNDNSKIKALENLYNQIMGPYSNKIKNYSNLYKNEFSLASLNSGDDPKKSIGFGVGSLVLATCTGAALSAIFIRIRARR
jgi:hypothetical protein